MIAEEDTYYTPDDLIAAKAIKNLSNEKIGREAGLHIRTVAEVFKGRAKKLPVLIETARQLGYRVNISFEKIEKAEAV